MLNRSVALLLIAFILSANFSKLFIYAGYEINKSYVANNLCENRDKPWLHCNGKCYLMKKIKQAEEKEKSEERQANKSLFQEAVVDTKTTAFNFHPKLLAVIAITHSKFYLPQRSTAIFHPPKTA